MNKVLQGDALTKLKELPSEYVNCIVTSPPYWGLRDYGVEGQLGLEKTFEEYIDKLCTIFDEAKRVLRKDGTCWVNLGDTYNGNKSGNTNGIYKDKIDKTKSWANSDSFNKIEQNLPSKSLCLIPFRFAIEMVNRGWICRNVIIWHKPNCMPSSAKDRFTVDFEYLFFFVKNKKYWFEQVFEPHSPAGIERAKYPVNKFGGQKNHLGALGKGAKGGSEVVKVELDPQGRNKRTVWTIPTKPYPEAHFAVYPAELIRTCIKAGCPKYVCKKCGKVREKIIDNSERVNTRPGLDTGNKKSGKELDPNKELHKSDLSKYRQQIVYKNKGYTDCHCNAGFRPGIVVDPFIGSGTTAEEAIRQGKDYIGIELKEEYIELIKKRLKKVTRPLF
jgi:DNA modification methylase